MSRPLTNEEIARLESLYNATTPGEWRHSKKPRYEIIAGDKSYGSCGCCAYDDIADTQDGEFLVEVHNAFPAILAELKRRKELTS